MKKVVAEVLRQSAVEESENVCTTVEERPFQGRASLYDQRGASALTQAPASYPFKNGSNSLNAGDPEDRISS